MKLKDSLLIIVQFIGILALAIAYGIDSAAFKRMPYLITHYNKGCYMLKEVDFSHTSTERYAKGNSY